MKNKEININPQKLRKELIKVYSDFLNLETKEKAVEKAKELDGLWSGNFLFSKEIEEAINNLTSFYTEPRISESQTIQILIKLQKK